LVFELGVYNLLILLQIVATGQLSAKDNSRTFPKNIN